MTPERLEELRNLAVDSTGPDAPYNPDIWALDEARRELVAEVDRLTKELEAYKAPPDFRNENHRANIKKVWAETIREFGHDPDKAAAAILPYAGVAIDAAERETYRAYGFAVAWGEAAAHYAEEAAARRGQIKSALAALDAGDIDAAREALTAEPPAGDTTRSGPPAPIVEMSKIDEFGVRWTGFEHARLDGPPVQSCNWRVNLRQAVNDAKGIRDWQKSVGITPDAEPVKREVIRLATDWKPATPDTDDAR